MDGRIDAVLSRLEAAERRIVAHIDERLASAVSSCAVQGEEGLPSATAAARSVVARDKKLREEDDRKRLKVRLPIIASPFFSICICPAFLIFRLPL